MGATHDWAGIAANNPIKARAEIHSFEDCREFLDGRECAYLGSNVIVREHCAEYGRTSYYAVVLYRTEIVRYYPDGSFSVDNDGHNTPTTSSRVTQFTPNGWYVWHEEKQLAMHGPKGERVWPATHDTKVKP